MKKYNLFLKIYLGFWLTTIVMIGAVIYLERLTGSGPVISHWRHTAGRSMSFYGGEAIRIFDAEGASGLGAFFKRLEKATGIRAFLFDSEGREVTGRAIKGSIAKAAMGAGNNPDQAVASLEELGMAAEKLAGAEKKAFIFAAAYPRPHPPDFFAGPPPQPLSGPPPGPPPAPPGFLSGPPPGPPGAPPHGFPLHFIPRLAIQLVLSAIVCYLLARYLTSPIIRIGEAARQLASGNLSVRVGPELGRRKDELSSLARDFDLMATRIESLLTSQRNLLRDVSHELRSPLARLNVALELCRQQVGTEAQGPLDRIEREAQKVNELIGQILVFNKLDSGATEIDRTDLDLSELVEDIVADANYEAGSERVVILHNEPCVLEGSRELLRRAIENTVRNALVHTQENGTVEVTLSSVQEPEKKAMRLTVRDHGKGVPKEALPLIFRPFYKLDSQESGAGLGLAISEAAVRLHGGSITARNAPDRGLIVEMIL